MNVIFDMDGLMFDTERVFIKAWDYAGEKIGVGKAGFMVYKTLGMNIEASYKVWKEEFGDRYDQEELSKYTKEFLQKYYSENKVPVKKGLYALLDYLKQIDCKMAVASSSPRWEVEKHLKDVGIYDYFDGIVCGDMIQNSKPDPEIYLKASEILEADPDQCIALEDSKNGLLSAYRAGCLPVMVPDLWQPDEETLNFIVGKYNDLEEVKAAFENGEADNFYYNDYEKKCEKIRKDNEELLELFEKYMEGLSPKTIRKHIGNVSFYINEFLLYEDALSFEHGVTMVDDFLGNFFIRKCMWSTPATIKDTAASIKKFYKCMMEHGKISKDYYKFLCDDIKMGMPIWQDDCEQFNNPDMNNPFMFF